jgi:DNA-binding winged helix-turn-helix (wHTH) protein
MPTAYKFGEYLLDVQRHTLSRGDEEINLGERAFGVLRLLVENAGSVVGRTELIEEVWRDVVVRDDSLARAVSDLRTAGRSRPHSSLGNLTPAEYAAAEKTLQC